MKQKDSLPPTVKWYRGTLPSFTQSSNSLTRKEGMCRISLGFRSVFREDIRLMFINQSYPLCTGHNFVEKLREQILDPYKHNIW